MFASFLSMAGSALSKHAQSRLNLSKDTQDQKARLLGQLSDDRSRLKLAKWSARKQRRAQEAEDRLAFGADHSKAASSGLRSLASSKVENLLGRARRRAQVTASKTSVVAPALDLRRSVAALNRFS